MEYIGVMSYGPLILAIDPNFPRDIQVLGALWVNQHDTGKQTSWRCVFPTESLSILQKIAILVYQSVFMMSCQPLTQLEVVAWWKHNFAENQHAQMRLPQADLLSK